VTKPQKINDAFAAAVTRAGRIDVVFNNAGYSITGEVEGAEVEVVRARFEVNAWGAMNASKEAVRVFRDVNKPAEGDCFRTVVSSVASPGDANVGTL